jgi:uncharacterized protein YndB with AHSA1/START domain
VARGTAIVALPPERVAKLVGDVARHPDWRPGVAIEDVRRDGDATDYIEVSGDGRIAYRLIAAPGGRRFTSRITDDTLPFGGQWTIDLAPEGDGTRVSIEERGEVRHPLYRFISTVVIGHDRSIKAYLAALKAVQA